MKNFITGIFYLTLLMGILNIPLSAHAQTITPGQGSLKDCSGNVWTINASGSVMEGDNYTPGGGGTSHLEVVDCTIYGEDVTGKGWFTLTSNADGQYWVSSAAPPTADTQTSSASQQMVLMYSPTGNVQPPGPDTPFEVAVMNLDGSGFQQITHDGTQKFLPHFSPDGTKILYTKFTAGGYSSPNAVSDVAVYDLKTGKETMVTSGGNNGYGTWSPDGSRIAFLHNAQLGAPLTEPTALVTIDLNGQTPPHIVGHASGAPNDLVWGDIAWSRENWILFVVGESANGAFCKSRVDKIRPDGSARTQVSDGGASCTPSGMEPLGDADPGWSSNGKTIYSSRGLPAPPAGATAPGSTQRSLYAFSSDAWTPGKAEVNRALPSDPGCVEGVPKGSPDGRHILLYRVCFNGTTPTPGIFVTDTKGSYRTFITNGFGADWNPVSLPLVTTSPNCTIGQSLVDRSGNVWTTSNGDVLKNGVAPAFSANVVDIAYIGGRVYQENSSNQWYDWRGGAWEAVYTNPMASCE